MGDRHAFRAKLHDYNGGIYFVTICTHKKQHIFGNISNAEMRYSTIGKIVLECLRSIPKHNDNIELWNYVVMPNHIHMVLAVGAQYFAPAPPGARDATPPAVHAPAPPVSQNTGCLKPPRHGEPCAYNHFNSRLAVIVRSFKAACSIEINLHLRAQNAVDSRIAVDSWRAQNIAPIRVWQRNYHEHIIRNQRAYDNIMAYIDNNVVSWDADCFNSNIQ